MCYPKPGPRCSAHARKALVKAHMNQINAIRWLDDQELYVKSREEFAHAEDEYHMTPAGQRDLQRRIDRGEDKGGILSARKEHFARKRIEALEAIGITPKNKRVEDSHTYTEPLQKVDSFTNSSFYSDDQVRPRWTSNHQELQKKVHDYIETSSRYVENLSLDEQFALRWYTSNGCKESYEHIVQGKTLESEDAIHQGNLDAVFARHQPTAPQVVYRGLQNLQMPNEILGYSPEAQAARVDYVKSLYTPGKEITIPHYSSTTADPGLAVQFADNNDVILEIQSSRVLPVGVVSAWEATEREMILDKGRTYKIVAVKTDIKYEMSNKNKEPKSMTVVQLVEVDTPIRTIQ